MITNIIFIRYTNII